MSTCVGEEYRTAYNKEEARKNISEAHINTIQLMQARIDSIKSEVNKGAQSIDTLKKFIYDALMNDWPDYYYEDLDYGDSEAIRSVTDPLGPLPDKIIFPNNYCLSGFGTLLLFKNTSGQILHAICLLFTLLILILWRFFRRKNITLWILSLQLIFILASVINGLIIGVDFLWGFWIYLLLNFLLITVEIFEKRKSQIISQNPC
jgi:hypothetical protein